MPPKDLITRTSRCCACGRPVWGPGSGDSKEPAPPPELCDYCAAASG
jgi:hypothetical protein